MKIYGDTNSGNCLKVKWVCDHLALPYIWIDVDTMKRETRTTPFLKLNPAGQVPTVEFDDGRTLAQSNAIIRYLARGSDLIPADAFAAAKMDEWLFWEQYSHEPYIAVARFWKHFFAKLTPQQEIELPVRMEKGYAALGVMEQHLAHHLFFVDERFGLADIALYAYTHCAGEGGFNLDNFPQVTAWLSRVAAQPGHVTIEHKP